MSRGTTLANALLMLKGELELNLTSGNATGSDSLYYTLLENTQKWLAGRFDWPFLETEATVSVIAGTTSATRYGTLPSLNFERPVEVTALWNDDWQKVDYGIGLREYNQHPSGDGGVSAEQSDPVRRWRVRPGAPTYFEIWPLPAVNTTIRFRGQAYPTALSTNGTFNSSAGLVLDDLLVVLFAAARYAARRKKEDAKLLFAQAEARLTDVRSAQLSSGAGIFVLGQPPKPDPGYRKPRLT